MSHPRAFAALLALGAASPSWAAECLPAADFAAEDPRPGDQFGCSVFVRGNTLLLGANLDDVDGDRVRDAGSVTPFGRTGGTWRREERLTAGDAEEGAQFGFSTSADGGWLAVGAPLADGGGIVDAGAVYLFERVDGRWIEKQKLPGTARGQRFGQALSLRGNTLLVGAPFDGGAGSLAGAVFVFERSGETWQGRQRLTGSDTAPFDNFGFSVSLGDGLAAVGAPFHDRRTAGGNSGAVYLFEKTDGVWRQRAQVTADDGAAEDQFGSAVSLSATALAVGARGDDAGGRRDAGSASVFERPDGGGWTRTALFPGEGAGDQLGASVAITGDRLLAGAQFNDASGADAGAAYLFVERPGPAPWELEERVPLPATAGDRFGQAVSADGDDLVAGAFLDDPRGIENAGSGVRCLAEREPPPAALELVKTAEGPAQVGSDLVYALTVTNRGTGPATGVVLDDRPETPGLLRPVKASDPGCTADGQGFLCRLADLPPGESETVRLTFRVLDACRSEAVNRATASATRAVAPATATVSSPVVRTVPALALEITGSSFVFAGQTALYTLEVTNPGPIRACDVVLENPVPAGLTSPGAPAGCTVGPGGIRCPIGPLPDGQSRRFEVTFVVPLDSRGDSFVNTARVTSRGAPPQTSMQETRIGSLPEEIPALGKSGLALLALSVALAALRTVRRRGGERFRYK